MKLLNVFLIWGVGIFFIFFQFNQDLFAYQYPVKKLRVTSLFGESRGDHFHTGMDFGGVQPIYPISPGEVLFYSDVNHPDSMHFGAGNYVMLEHFDGLRSYYFHLADGSINGNLGKVTEDDSLAQMGNSGHSLGNHLHLVLVNTKSKELLNPELLLPKVNEKVAPKISSFFTILKGRVYKFNRNSKLKYSGVMPFYVIAGDIKYFFGKKMTLNAMTGMGLKSLEFQVDGKVFRSYDFSRVTINKNEELVIGDKYKFSDVYGLSFNYKLGEFTPSAKSHKFTIIAEDWNDNTTVKNYTIRFN